MTENLYSSIIYFELPESTYFVSLGEEISLQ